MRVLLTSVGHALPKEWHVKWFQGGFKLKAHRLLDHSTIGLRVIKKKEETVANKWVWCQRRQLVLYPTTFQLDAANAVHDCKVVSRLCYRRGPADTQRPLALSVQQVTSPF